MSKNAYKLIVLGLLTMVTLAYTNCGQKSQLQFVSANSVGEQSAFSSTVYKITRAHCVACHSVTSPMHASEDVNTALTAAKTKINWDTPENSRLVAKLRDENHNCWSDCSSDAEEMLEAIVEMKSMMATSGEDPTGEVTNTNYIATTESRAIQTELDDVANPQKSNTVRLNVEAAMVTPPMAIKTDATRGKYLTVPNNGANATLATTDASAGIAYLNFNVRVAGQYRVWLYVNAPNANDNGFYVRYDKTGNYTTFDATANGTDYGWMLVPTLNQTLAVGTHTLEIRQRKDGASINSVIVTADTTFNGTDVGSFVGVTLSYDLSSILKTTDVKLLVDIADYDPYSYKILNPRIVSGTKNVHVKNMRILLNKYYSTQNSAYTTVETITTPAAPAISTLSTVINKDKGLLIDKLSFDFEKLEITTATTVTPGGGGGTTVDPAQSLALFKTTVYPVSRANCISCHQTTDPVHASANAQIAHDTVLADGNELVNFDSPTNSRLYIKVKVNRHNCGSTANCDNIAAQFLSGIKTWGALYGY